MQKWFQKFVLFLAVVTVMGHTILPHHHDVKPDNASHDHHDSQFAGHHHHDQENNDQDHDSSPLNDLDHSSEFGKFVTKPVTISEYLLKAPSNFILLQVYDLCACIDLSPIIRPPIENSCFSSSIYCYCLPLRAPPAMA